MPGPDNCDNSPISNYKFTGYELDEEEDLNLYHAEARMCDPVIGRFNSVDPMAHLYPGYTPYHYVLNNPLSFIDPTGLCPEEMSDSDDSVC
jgi:RHS repeat-associated protein